MYIHIHTQNIQTQVCILCKYAYMNLLTWAGARICEAQTPENWYKSIQPIYIHAHIHVCYTDVQMNTNIHVEICMYVCIYTCTNIHVYIYIYIHVQICMYVLA